MRRRFPAFTIVEVMIVVVIIAALTTIVAASSITTQIQTRDRVRSTKATLVANALEKYFDKHGEYPSPKAIVNDYAGNTGTVVAGILSLKDASILIMPNAPSGTTNSIASALGSNDVMAYTATSTVGNDTCQNTATSGCEQFTLAYKKESDDVTVTINSTHKVRPDDNTSPLDAPTTPTLSAVQSGSSLIATSSVTSCSTDPVMSARYSFQYQVNAGSWTSWSSWQGGNTYTLSSGLTNAANYGFHVRTRCDSATNYSDTSATSGTANVTYYAIPTAPAAPSLSIALSGANVVSTSATATCNYGTAKYRIDHRTNDGAWTTGTWSTGLTYSTAAADGVKYGSTVTAQCVNGTQTTTGTAGSEVTYTDPIATPGTPTVSSATYTAKTWTWTAASCPSGTSPAYEYLFSSSTGSASWVATAGTTATNVAATSQGIYYWSSVHQRCYNAYATSDYGASGVGGTFVVPMAFAQLQKWAMRVDSGPYARLRFNTFSTTCASGAVLEMYIEASWDDSTFADDTGWFTVAAGNERLMTSHTIPTNGKAEFWPRTRCRNTTTNYAQNASGANNVGRLYNTGNLYNRGSSKYNVSCGWGSSGDSWCSGGYNSSGTNASGTSYDACQIFTGGIEDSSNRWTPLTTYGTGTACWTA